MWLCSMAQHKDPERWAALSNSAIMKDVVACTWAFHTGQIYFCLNKTILWRKGAESLAPLMLKLNFLIPALLFVFKILGHFFWTLCFTQDVWFESLFTPGPLCTYIFCLNVAHEIIPYHSTLSLFIHWLTQRRTCEVLGWLTSSFILPHVPGMKHRFELLCIYMCTTDWAYLFLCVDDLIRKRQWRKWHRIVVMIDGPWTDGCTGLRSALRMKKTKIKWNWRQTLCDIKVGSMYSGAYIRGPGK